MLYGRIACPPSKSYSHRAVFAAALSRTTSRIQDVLKSEDVESTIRACRGFGAKIHWEDSTLMVKGGGPILPARIDAANSGTTIRIAAAIAGLGDGESSLTGDGSLRKRPMMPLLAALESMGAKCTSDGGNPPVTISGIIAGGQVGISGDVSSQFVSALMLAAPLTEKGITLEIGGHLVSRPYLDATIATMEKFGTTVDTIKEYKKYSIPPQPYSGTDFVVPSDASNLALLLSAAVLVGDGLSIGIKTSSLPQGDDAFLDILGKLGVMVAEKDGVLVTKSPEKLNGGRFDLNNTPDLLPALAILALKSKNPIEIYNVGHARLKETDRIKILCDELAKAGLDIQERPDGMVIKPGEPARADFDSHNDHRLAMAFCIAGIYIGECTVSDIESAAVSYPDFVGDINRAGGRITLA